MNQKMKVGTLGRGSCLGVACPIWLHHKKYGCGVLIDIKAHLSVLRGLYFVHNQHVTYGAGGLINCFL